MKRSAPLKPSKILPRRIPYKLDRNGVLTVDTGDLVASPAFREQVDAAAKLQRSAPLVAKVPMRKSSRPKMTPARKLAKGHDCTLRLPGCPNDTETTVLCHLRQFNGGGMGIKPWDGEAILADDWCHSRIDGRVPWIKGAPEDFNLWEHIAWAIVRTHRIMRAAGVLLMKGEQQ